MLARRIHLLRRRLQESRYRLVHMYRKLALSAYSMTFIATKQVWRISTDGINIYFDPDWLQKLGDVELDFILSHQLMHIALGHIERPEYYYGDKYHLAADIVANGMLSKFGWNYKKLPHIGKIRYETYIPTVNGAEITSIEAIRCIPFDPSVMKQSERRRFLIDSDECWNRRGAIGPKETVVLCPDDKDPENLEYNGIDYGGDYRPAKEVFPSDDEGSEDSDTSDNSNKEMASDKTRRIKQAINLLRQETQNKEAGGQSESMERAFAENHAAELDWRTILDSFIQEEVYDYSFMPPDKRLNETDLFLPDYNVKHETVKDVLFMVDTSGSVKDEMLAMAYDEIKQALMQFNGMLSGTIAFFDTRVYNAVPFSSVSDIKSIRPIGGGGTDYGAIFSYIRDNMTNRPSSIVVITDGDGDYPDEGAADNIPVLWLIIGKNDAPWGRCVRIKA